MLFALLAAGCGLISSDITSIKFDLPERTYSFNTAQAGVSLPGLTTLPSVPCDTATDCCTRANLLSPGVDCNLLTCDTGVCAVTTTIETPPQMVDLKKECPQLSGFDSQSVIDVTISRIGYDILTNTLNVDLPAVELFVAAQGAATTADPSAKRFGTVPPTPAGAMPSGGTVALDSEGQNAFKAFAHNFGTPFVFLARTVVVIRGGAPVPMGAVSLKITGQLKAKPDL